MKTTVPPQVSWLWYLCDVGVREGGTNSGARLVIQIFTSLPFKPDPWSTHNPFPSHPLTIFLSHSPPPPPSPHTSTHHPINDLPEHNVFPVQPWCLHSSYEELRPVGVLAGIGHAEPTGAIVLELKVLVCEPLPIDALSCKYDIAETLDLYTYGTRCHGQRVIIQ